MDALKLAVKRPGFTLVVAFLAALTPAGFGNAGHGQHFDGSTLCRWSQTWHGPNSIWRPLRPYYVPRPADPCLYGGYGHGCRFAVDVECYTEDSAECENGNLAGYGESPAMPAGLERLGQIPNDLGISAGAAPGAPARPGR
jgi:hypothetical protein